MSDEGTVPCLGWYHVTYDVIPEATHLHIQGCIEYPGIRFVWSLNTVTNERRHRFFIRGTEYESLNAAIAAWKPPKRKKRRRVRL